MAWWARNVLKAGQAEKAAGAPRTHWPVKPKGGCQGWAEEDRGSWGARPPPPWSLRSPSLPLMPEETTPLLLRGQLPFSGAAAPTSCPHRRRKVDRLLGTPQADPRTPWRPRMPGKLRVAGVWCGLVTARTGYSGVINVHRGHTNAVCHGDSWPVRSDGSPHNCGLPGLSGQEPRAGGDQAHRDGRQHCSLRPLRGVQEGDTGQEATVRSAERRPTRPLPQASWKPKLPTEPWPGGA